MNVRDLRVSRFINRNWPYIIMFIFVFVVSLAIFLGQKQSSKEKETYQPHKVQLVSKEKIEQRQKAVEKIFQENLPLYLFILSFNLLIILVFFLGLFTDGFLFYKWRRKEQILQRTIDDSRVKWKISDIFKFVIMFLAASYVFMIIEAILFKKFPVLNNRSFRMIFNTTVTDTLGILFVINFVVFTYRQQIVAIGLTLKNLTKNIFYGLAGYVAIIPIMFLTLFATTVVINYFKLTPPVQPIVDLLLKEKKMSMLIYASIFAAVAGPIMEEIFFRGFMYNALKKKMGILLSMLLTSIIFSLLHAHLIGIVPILILGLLLNYLYEKTGSLIPSIVVHITHNLASLAMVFMMKAIDFK